MTTVTEIADQLYRISTPVPPEVIPGGFTFNQFLIVDDEPLLFHTGPRKMFPLVQGAVASVIDPAKLRWISFSHYEADECGSLNDWLELAPHAITANAICAGVTRTPAFEKIPGHEEMERMALARNPRGRLTTPEDVAGALVALSEPGCGWISGNVINVDGGEEIVA